MSRLYNTSCRLASCFFFVAWMIAIHSCCCCGCDIVSVMDSHSSSSSSLILLRGGGGGSKASRWERLQLEGTTAATRRKKSQINDSHPIAAAAAMSSGRRACGLYIWDAPSALLHKWCHHLLRDCVYEGRGGQKFVRIEPGSILQLLYPCSRYSPDRCVICGGTFRDHLTLWWSKHLYTPYDRMLDKVYDNGVVVEEKRVPVPSTGNNNNNNNNNNTIMGKKIARRRQKQVHAIVYSPPEHVFHRRYVMDGEHLLRNIPREAKALRKRVILKAVQGMQSPEQHQPAGGSDTSSKVWFIVPGVVPEKDGKRASALLGFTRTMLLAAIDNLLYLEAVDNAKSSK